MDERNNDFDFDFTPIGQAIKKARTSRGMTRDELARIVDYDPRHLQAIENEGQKPSLELFIQLVTMFGVSVDEYIFPDNEVKKSSVRRRLDAELDKLNDKELSVVEATVSGYVRQKSQRNKPLVFFCPFLIGRNAVAIDGAASNRILLLPASVARVTLHGVNDTVFAFLHNAYMVGFSVAFPIKKDNIACRRLIASVFPLSVTLKPICTVHAACEFWDNPAFDITTLVGTPRYEAGTPFHTPIKAIPTPIRLTALISELCQSDLHNRLVTAACERPPVWIIPQHMGGILRVAIAVPT